MFQREEEDKTLDELSNVEIDNLPQRVQSNDSKHDQELGRRMDDLRNEKSLTKT